MPWNFPLTIAAWKLGPALAAGNTVVLKPAELTPLTALRFAALALEAGLPEGVLNVVAGPGVTCGARLVEHPDVAKIAFTGSTAVGRGIAAAAADTIKRVTLELGGKSPNIVFADADLEAAAAAAPGAVFGNAGQDCCARSRILVQSSVLDEFLAAARRGGRGDPGRRSARPTTADGAADLGRAPVAGASFLDDDAPVAIRGERARRRRLLVCAAVLSPVVRRRSRRARGDLRPGRRGDPVSMRSGGDRARQRDDLRPLGLGLDRDGARALRVARALETGVISINSNSSVRVSTPFGGFKQSGYGRELGPDALEHYTELKTSSTRPHEPVSAERSV